MTTIAAAQTSKGIVLASDSQTVCGFRKYPNIHPKLWVRDQYSFGCAGRTRDIQVVRNFTKWPRYRPDEEHDIEGFLVKQVVPAIWKAAKDNGVVHSYETFEYVDVHMLLAFDDWLVEISADGAVDVSLPGRMAIGSGADLAMGALGGEGPWTERDVVNAVKKSREVDLGSGGPYIFVLNARTQKLRALEE